MNSTRSQNQLCTVTPISSLCSVFTFHFGLCLMDLMSMMWHFFDMFSYFTLFDSIHFQRCNPLYLLQHINSYHKLARPNYFTIYPYCCYYCCYYYCCRYYYYYYYYCYCYYYYYLYYYDFYYHYVCYYYCSRYFI